jgi:hypothetical protein
VLRGFDGHPMMPSVFQVGLFARKSEVFFNSLLLPPFSQRIDFSIKRKDVNSFSSASG